MQTFLPYSDFAQSAASLDMRRLGKQRVEVLQILNALTGRSNGWLTHPATILWRDHIPALVTYGLRVCEEWTGRGYKDTVKDKLLVIARESSIDMESPIEVPTLILERDFNRSHQSNLIRKDPIYYRPIFGWEVPDDLPYIWK